uniref:hypothetical protein n=1 Tax=Ornithobacterium rhinotracheale TaxID=28251 RepID=UPI0039A6200B
MYLKSKKLIFALFVISLFLIGLGLNDIRADFAVGKPITKSLISLIIICGIPACTFFYRLYIAKDVK